MKLYKAGFYDYDGLQHEVTLEAEDTMDVTFQIAGITRDQNWVMHLLVDITVEGEPELIIDNTNG